LGAHRNTISKRVNSYRAQERKTEKKRTEPRRTRNISSGKASHSARERLHY
jgi:hypothetical protein